MEITFNENLVIIVDIYNDDEIKECIKELDSRKILYTKELKNKYNNATRFKIHYSISESMRKPIKSLL